MAYLETTLISHRRRVCSLYKNALRCLESYYQKRPEFRYQAVLMRERFEQNRSVLDMMKAKELLFAGEEELFRKIHYQPMKFPHSPGGVAYERDVIAPDWVMDYWHPLEKAQYPTYFATREKRKEEFIKMWEKKYGKYDAAGDHH